MLEIYRLRYRGTTHGNMMPRDKGNHSLSLVNYLYRLMHLNLFTHFDIRKCVAFVIANNDKDVRFIFQNTTRFGYFLV